MSVSQESTPSFELLHTTTYHDQPPAAEPSASLGQVFLNPTEVAPVTLLEPPSSKNLALLRCAGRVAAAVVLVASNFVTPTAPETLATSQSVEQPSPHQFPVTSAESIRTADALLASTKHSDIFSDEEGIYLKKLRQQTGIPLASEDLTRTDEAQIFFDAEEKVAKKYGLTLHDNTSAVNKLSQDKIFGGHQNMSVQTAFDITKSYLKQSGIDFELAPSEGPSNGLTAPTSANTSSENTKNNLMTLVEFVGELPQEYIDYTNSGKGMKIEMAAARDPQHTPTLAYAVRIADQNRIVFNDSDKMNQDVFPHEWYHLLDAAEAQGADNTGNDPQYIKLNQDENVYESDYVQEGAQFSYDTMQYKAMRLKSKRLEMAALMSKNWDAACKYQEDNKEEITALGNKVVIMDPYSTVNDVEDKAELGKALMRPIEWSERLDKTTPAINKKFALLLARLVQNDPRDAHYFSDISMRSDTSLGWGESCQ